MSRHRAIRNLTRDDFYDQDDDYSQSPGSYNESPYSSDLAQYMVRRDGSNYVHDDYDEDHYDDHEEDDTEILNNCLDYIYDTFGDVFNEDDLVDALRRNNYDADKAIDELTHEDYEPAPKQSAKPAAAKKQQKQQQPVKQQPASANKQQQPKTAATPTPTTTKPAATSKTPAAPAATTQGKKDVKPFTFNEPSPDDINLAKREKAFSKKEHSAKPNVPKEAEEAKPFTPIVKGGQKQQQKQQKQQQQQQQAQQTTITATSKGKQKPAKEAKAATPSKSTKQIETDLAAMGLSTERIEETREDDEERLEKMRAAKKKIKQPTIEERPTDTKDTVNLVVIGHVDAGKSTLMGHLLYLLGNVDKKVMHKYEKLSKEQGKASFAYAWVLDANEEERARGVTIDVGVTHFNTPHKYITLLDAPGHRDFIPNMITGAAQADAAVLVVDANTGEFEAGFQSGGQTKEHVLLVRSLGVTQLVVAINKLDMVGWSKERFDFIQSKLSAFLKQSGFKVDTNVWFVPCSGLTGENLVKPATEPALKEWYTGPTLVDRIDNLAPTERITTKPLRMVVSDVFKAQTTGVTVAGKLEAGAVTLGQTVLIMPLNELATVKAIERHGELVKTAYAGDHIALGITLQSMEMSSLSVGQIVCDPENPIRVCTRFEARIITFDLKVPITKGYQVELHAQSINVPANLSRLLSILDKNTGEETKKKPRCLVKNTTAIVEITTNTPICLEPYSEYKALGRVMLREGGATIATGIVTAIKEAKKKKKQKKVKE